MEEQWEDPFFQSVGPLIRATVHEQVLASRVTMDITVEQDVTTFQSLPHHHLGRAVLRELLHAGRNPLPVEIHATEGGTVVTNDDTVWVEHRDDLKYEIIP